MATTAKQVTLAIASDPAGPDPTVEADVAPIGQVLGNLLSNALRHTAPGGHVELPVASRHGWLELQVADDGDGIAAEHLPHIFERFYRARHGQIPGARRHRGGLAISRPIAETHGGDLNAASDGPGKGGSAHPPPSPAVGQILTESS